MRPAADQRHRADDGPAVHRPLPRRRRHYRRLDLRLDVWLMGYMMPVERAFVSPDFVRLGTRLGCAEMIRSGVTCFADMYYFEDAIAKATADAGLRALCAQTVLRFPTPDATSYEDSLARARDFIERWRGHPL